MSRPFRKALLSIGAPIVGVGVGLGLIPLLRGDVSPVTSGVILGVFGTMCLVAVGFAIWNVRRGEPRRKAKLQIWMKH